MGGKELAAIHLNRWMPGVVRRLAQFKALQRQFHRVMGGGTAMMALQRLG